MAGLDVAGRHHNFMIRDKLRFLSIFLLRLKEAELLPCVNLFNQPIMECSYQNYAHNKSQKYAIISFAISFVCSLVAVASKSNW